MQQDNKIKKQQIIGMLVSIAIVIIMYFMPAPADLGVAGWRTISILLVFLILLVTEAFPAGVISDIDACIGSGSKYWRWVYRICEPCYLFHSGILWDFSGDR